MANIKTDKLLSTAKAVLKLNDRGNYTQPSEHLYPHQWLWDSCFIAIGLRHIDTLRAQTELKSLLRGQWHNGMLPCIIFRDDPIYRPARNQWRSWVSPFSPDDVTTSGITQPPMLAQAVYSVGQKLPWSERRSWYKFMLPAITAYHEWLYRERDPHHEGLVLLIHPWETGLDNSPPWMSELHEHLMPFWIRVVEKVHLDSFIKYFRTDTKYVPIEQRSSIAESMAMYDTQLRLRRKAYDINRILDHSLFSIEDIAFNSIFIRANTLLKEMAESVKYPLSSDLVVNIKLTENALENLWDPYNSEFYCRDFVTHKLIKTPSISSLMPLYSGIISKDKAEVLVSKIKNEHLYYTHYPLPSVPIDSYWFNRQRYWQGPSWINMNWLIIDGLKRYGYNDLAQTLTAKTLEMVELSGFYEYFDPIDGSGLGINNFSWSAALTIDLTN